MQYVGVYSCPLLAFTPCSLYVFVKKTFDPPTDVRQAGVHICPTCLQSEFSFFSLHYHNLFFVNML